MGHDTIKLLWFDLDVLPVLVNKLLTFRADFKSKYYGYKCVTFDAKIMKFFFVVQCKNPLQCQPILFI